MNTPITKAALLVAGFTENANHLVHEPDECFEFEDLEVVIEKDDTGELKPPKVNVTFYPLEGSAGFPGVNTMEDLVILKRFLYPD